MNSHPLVPAGYTLVKDPHYIRALGDIFYAPAIGRWLPVQLLIGRAKGDVIVATPEATPQVAPQVTFEAMELADNIARAIQPQMSVDAKNGNAVAVRGLDYISGIVAKELAKFKISSK